MRPNYQLIGRIYDIVENALWALLAAAVIYFSAFVLPKVPDIRAQIAETRAKEIAEEQAHYCDKLGIQARTQNYNECLLILGEFRLKVEQRVDQEYEF
jgi:hypothetical protein